VSGSLVFWKSIERLVTVVIIPIHKKGVRSGWTNYWSTSLLSLPKKWVPSALKKDAAN